MKLQALQEARRLHKSKTLTHEEMMEFIGKEAAKTYSGYIFDLHKSDKYNQLPVDEQVRKYEDAMNKALEKHNKPFRIEAATSDPDGGSSRWHIIY
jgi:hypothetical protein